MKQKWSMECSFTLAGSTEDPSNDSPWGAVARQQKAGPTTDGTSCRLPSAALGCLWIRPLPPGQPSESRSGLHVQRWLLSIDSLQRDLQNTAWYFRPCPKNPMISQASEEAAVQLFLFIKAVRKKKQARRNKLYIVWHRRGSQFSLCQLVSLLLCFATDSMCQDEICHYTL